MDYFETLPMDPWFVMTREGYSNYYSIYLGFQHFATFNPQVTNCELRHENCLQQILRRLFFCHKLQVQLHYILSEVAESLL